MTARLMWSRGAGMAVLVSGTSKVDNSNLLYIAFALDAENPASFMFGANVACYDQNETMCQVLSSSPQPPQPIMN